MPNDYGTASRLLKLVDEIDSGRPLRLKDIEERYGVTAACAANYRDWVAQHRDLVEGDREGRAKVWYRKPDTDGSPESIARAGVLSFAVGALAALGGTPHFESLVALADQARNALPEGARPRLDRMARNFQVRVAHRSRNGDRAQHLASALLAVEERRVCTLRYEKSSGEQQRYEIEPWGLLMYRDRLLLVAGKRVDGRRAPQRRFFDLDGVVALQVHEGERFREHAERHTDYDTIFGDYIGIYCDTDGPVEDVVLRVRGRHAVALRQREVHRSQQLGETVDGWTEVRLRVVVCEDFKSFVLSMLPDIRVVQPRSLIDRLDAAIHGYRVG
jgi:predicted DNA-binding transcriptional regulator YafY